MNATAAGVGLLADAALGEPPITIHPIARFGALMEKVEAHTYAPRRLNGAVHAAVGVAVAAGAGFALRRVIGATAATTVAVTICAAGRMLDAEAALIAGHLVQGELDQARGRLPVLAGRDPTDLDANEISRAMIESLAENEVDAVTATLFWGAIGGASAAMVHRAANTMDAMVGYRNPSYEPFGWVTARLDDVLNFVPARLTAAAVAIVRPTRARHIVRIVLRDARKHPSPNGGIVEAAFAAALDLRLGGTNIYHHTAEDRGLLGDGRPPTPIDIAAAIKLRRDSTIVVACLLVAAAAAAHTAGFRRRR